MKSEPKDDSGTIFGYYYSVILIPAQVLQEAFFTLNEDTNKMVVCQRRPHPTREVILLTILFLFLTACSGEANIAGSQTQDEPIIFDSIDPLETPAIPGEKISNGEYLRFKSYSVEDGLSQSTVFCILQDSQGYIWFGTEDGLNKFDGYSITVYKNDPDDPNSLSSNWVQTMLEDDAGILWLGTRDGGLNRFDRDLDQFTHYHNDPSNPASLSDDEITTLYQGQDGSLWIGTGSGGLEKFDPKSESFLHYQHDSTEPNSLSDDSILSIYQTKDGILWVGTNGGGLNRFDPKTDLFTRYKNIANAPKSLIDNTVLSIFEDSSGTLWIGTNSGLEQFDRRDETFSHFQNDPNNVKSLAHNTVQTIFEDTSGSLWIGTYGGGLDYFDRESGSFFHYRNAPGDPNSISSNIILTILQDREGILWFGTIGGGVNRLQLGRVNFTHYKNDPQNPNSISNDMIRRFYQNQDGSIWVGTMFGGLNYFDPQTQTWENYRNDPNDPLSLSDDFVSEIYRDRSGTLWIGTIHGLDRFEPETETFTHFNVNPDALNDSSRIEVTTIYESQDGLFWIGTTHGLYRFDRQQESWSQKIDFNPDEPQDIYIYIMSEDQKGLLWIGTLGKGIYILDPTTEVLTHYQNIPGNSQSLSQNFVTALLIDQTGSVWIGTNGSGLDRFDPGKNTFEHYREKDGLPNDAVYCLLADEGGNIWISTNDGLSRFDPKTEIFVNYDVTDGLQSNEFNGKACLIANSGEMIFGGINGFNVFMPERIQSNSVIPPVMINSISKNNEAINLEWGADGLSEISLDWPVDSFEFEYAALSFAAPEKNQYAYYLDGFEETWKDVGNRKFGEYTNLPGGTYTLRVKGSNNDGVWNEVGIAVQITVVPPFWQTWWFFGIGILATLGLLYGGYRLRVRSLEVRGQMLESQVEQRTSELMQIQADLKNSEMEKAISEERNRLARDLHDSVTQSIYSLTLLAEAGQRMIRSGRLSQAEDNQSRLGEIAQQALQEMRLLVYELRPQVLQTEGLIGAVEHRLEAVERRAGINARMQIDMEIDLQQNLEEELFRISMEALNNALKHAKATEVDLSLQTDKENLILTIEDNGRGFDPALARSHGGMGISSMTERVENIGGSLFIQSQIGGGTKISVSVPLSTNHPHPADTQEEHI